MLRASVEMNGKTVNLRPLSTGVTDNVDDENIGSAVDGAKDLIEFTDAVLGDDDALLVKRRHQVISAVGPKGFVDAACVVGNFERMVRIADGAGLPLDNAIKAFSEDIREDLGINQYASATHSKKTGPLMRYIAQLARPLVGLLFKLKARLPFSIS